jgi:hypothetical protein
MKKTLLAIALIALVIYACKKKTDDSGSSTTITTTTSITYTGTGSATQGVGKTTTTSLYSCMGGRATALGTITSTDGKVWALPADVNFTAGAKLPDLFNQCNGKSPASLAAVDTASVPVTVIDADGVVISGFVFGDNYFELYVNGKLVGVDGVPYTPFNSCFVKFKAKRPIKYAIKAVDWEENLGTGTENNGGNPLYAGDAGFIAKFSDGTQTSAAWKAQTFYIAPLANPNCVTESGLTRTSTGCGLPTSLDNTYALHWTVPATWFATDYDFSTWPTAVIYTANAVGAKEPYTNFTTQFGSAQFIWTSNLVLDNLVLFRFTGN